MKTRIERKSRRFNERKLAQRPIRGDPQSVMTVFRLTLPPARQPSPRDIRSLQKRAPFIAPADRLDPNNRANLPNQRSRRRAGRGSPEKDRVSVPVFADPSPRFGLSFSSRMARTPNRHRQHSSLSSPARRLQFEDLGEPADLVGTPVNAARVFGRSSPLFTSPTRPGNAKTNLFEVGPDFERGARPRQDLHPPVGGSPHCRAKRPCSRRDK